MEAPHSPEARVGVRVGVERAGISLGPLLCVYVLPANRLLPERRRRDSNPRYPVKRYNTLAGCRLQPLGHSSSEREYPKGARLLTSGGPFWLSKAVSDLRRLRRGCRACCRRARRRGFAGRISPLLVAR